MMHIQLCLKNFNEKITSEFQSGEPFRLEMIIKIEEVTARIICIIIIKKLKACSKLEIIDHRTSRKIS